LNVPEIELELNVLVPDAVREIVEKFVTLGVVALIVICAAVPVPKPTLTIPAPDTESALLIVVVELPPVVLPVAVRLRVEKFVTLGVVAEIVMLRAPAPTEIIPAPDILRRLEYVPLELLVVFPSAVREMFEVWTLAEIVMVDAA
jgi:hypothetical protein